VEPEYIIINAYLDDVKCQPSQETPYAAAMDLRANTLLPVRVNPGLTVRVPTGVHLEIPIGFAGLVVPRSGMAAQYKVTVLNSPGLIDPDFRGEIEVLVTNMGQAPFVLEPLERFAQLAFVRQPVVTLNYVGKLSDLSPTKRGQGGFGHTGVK